jgi:hypothetical protein
MERKQDDRTTQEDEPSTGGHHRTKATRPFMRSPRPVVTRVPGRKKKVRRRKLEGRKAGRLAGRKVGMQEGRSMARRKIAQLK